MTPGSSPASTPVARCRACHAPEAGLRPVLSMDPMPLAGMFCASADEAVGAPVFPLTWVHCERCGVVQVLEDIADDALYARYNYASSTVGGLVRHFAEYAGFLAQTYRDDDVRFLEIGCNDGVLLSQLPRGWELIGCDPSDVAANAARTSDRYALINRPFDEQTVRDHGLEGRLDVISGSNCLAHISDLRAVFEAVWLALKRDGHLWVEVHELDALLSGAQWDTIYHEHKVEWSESALIRSLAGLGLEHVSTWRTPMHGGALRVQFRKGERPMSFGGGGVAPPPGLEALQRAYQHRYETTAARTLRRLQHAGQAIAAYGAAGRANVYLNQLPDLRFAYIVDESPLRARKYIPRVATPIVEPAQLTQAPVAACLIAAWNYRDDIIAKNPAFRGEWLTAFE